MNRIQATDIRPGMIVRTTENTGSAVRSIFNTPNSDTGKHDRINLVLANGVTILNLRPTDPVAMGEPV